MSKFLDTVRVLFSIYVRFARPLLQVAPAVTASSWKFFANLDISVVFLEPLVWLFNTSITCYKLHADHQSQMHG